jgi:hypothetical protein
MGDEESQFEGRLADDQTAREAVESAFELHEALRVVAAQPLPAPASRRAVIMEPVSMCIGVAAACLLLALACLLWPGAEHRNRQAENDEVMQDEAAAVALAWTEVHGWQTDVRPAADAAAALRVRDWSMPVTAEEEGTSVSSAVEVPAWLLTAAEAILAQRSEEMQ